MRTAERGAGITLEGGEFSIAGQASWSSSEKPGRATVYAYAAVMRWKA